MTGHLHDGPDDDEGGPPVQQPAPHHAKTSSPSTAAEVLDPSVPDPGERGMRVPDPSLLAEPARVAALQALRDAAAAVAALALFARASAAGHPPVPSAVPPYLLDRLDEHDRRAAAGGVRRCGHLRHTGGPPVLLPWELGALRCGPCAVKAQARLPGTLEDHRCDCCGEPSDRLSTGVVLIRGLVVPVGVCGACRLVGPA